MSKRTHVAFGLLLASLLLRTDLMPFIPIVFLASVLPDLDLLLRDLPLIEHRKTFHNVWFLILVYALAVRFSPRVSYLMVIGVLSHLMMDSLTKQGVMWLYPLSRSKLSGPFRTGGAFDNSMFLMLMLASMYVLVQGFLP
ncbi:MAG: metal-dependent hydrolase [Candidatus Korarchaeum sp.]